MEKPNPNAPLMLTEPEVTQDISAALMTGVVYAASRKVKPGYGVQSRMLRALAQGADRTATGSAKAFLFEAMVERLLEEYNIIEKQEKKELDNSVI